MIIKAIKAIKYVIRDNLVSALLPLVAYVFLVYNVSLVKFVLSEKTLHC